MYGILFNQDRLTISANREIEALLKQELQQIVNDYQSMQVSKKHSWSAAVYHFFLPSTLPIVDKTIIQAKNMDDLLSAVCKIEHNIYVEINQILLKLDKSIPLIEQTGIFDEVKEKINFLNKINEYLVKHIHVFLIDKYNQSPECKKILFYNTKLDKRIDADRVAESNTSDLDRILSLTSDNSDLTKLISRFKSIEPAFELDYIQSINPQVTQEVLDESNKNTVVFLNSMKAFVALSLLKLEKTDVGKHLIKKLVLPLEDKEHYFDLCINYSAEASVLCIETRDLGSYAKNPGDENDHPNERGTFREAVKPIIKNAGAPSAVMIPVWPGEGEDMVSICGIFFQDIEKIPRAIENLISGFFSFDKEENLIYSPFHIEVGHELIHGLHNSRGINRVKIAEFITKSIWHNAEEYWTIDGGNLCENALNRAFNLSERFGHTGLPVYAIIKPEVETNKAFLSSNLSDYARALQ